jgi:hypothetical protein
MSWQGKRNVALVYEQQFVSRIELAIAPASPEATMRVQLISLLLGFLGLVSALSSTGSKLLVILEEEADKSKYSQFWTDLESKVFSI